LIFQVFYYQTIGRQSFRLPFIIPIIGGYGDPNWGWGILAWGVVMWFAPNKDVFRVLQRLWANYRRSS
jgi:hypothetical protein